MRIEKPTIGRAPAQRIIARERFHRYATRSSRGKEKWELVALPIDGAECARQGFNLVGQALDLNVLGDIKYLELKRLAALKRDEMTTDEGVALGEILSQLPRATVVDIDIDGDDAAASKSIALKMIEEFATKGIEVVAYHSSGPQRGGLHLAFGAVADPKHPDLGRMVGRLVAEVAADAGLVAAKGSNVSFDGIPLSWVLSSEADAAEPGAKLDLIPFNHDPSSRGRLFRPIGGLNKTETARKCIASWSPFSIPTPIDAAFLAQIPAARPAFKKATSKKIYTFEKIERARTHQRKDHQLTPLIDALKSIYRPGDNHDVRLALSAIAISKSIMTRDDWIYAMGIAFRDHEDAAAAWSSTATRLKLGQNCKGANWLRGRLGHDKIWTIARAIADITKEKVAFVAIRFGRPYSDKIALKAVGEIFYDSKVKAYALEPENERRQKRLEQLIFRSRKSSRCLQYQHKAECSGCDAETYTTRIRCDWLETCPTCHSKFLMQLESWMHQNWRDRSRYHFTVYDGLESKKTAQELLDTTMKTLNPHLKALRVCYPNVDGTWSIFAISDEHNLNNYLVGASRWNEETDSIDPMVQPTRSASNIGKREAIRHMIDALSRRFLTIQTLFERKEYELAAELLETLYASHRVTGTKDPTGWPTKAMLAEIIRDNVKKPDDELCECPFDMPERHHYKHIPTGWSISSADKYPMSPRKILSRHQTDIDMGRAPPIVERSFFKVARRE